MDRSVAARLLGVGPAATDAEVRQAFRAGIRARHPDLGGDEHDAHRFIAAYRLLLDTTPGPVTDPPPARARRTTRTPASPPPPFPRQPFHLVRLDADTLAVDAPADETFRLLVDAAHDVGEVTYLDRSVPILEILCSFVGEPATSLVLTVQGRATGTEVFCTVESIEARPAPPTAAVVDVLEDALLARAPSP